MASVDDVVTVLRQIATNLSQLIQRVGSIFPRISGTFTLTAAATTTVTQTGITATSVVLLSPTNAAAATLMGSAKALYISALTPGASFQVATANATAAAGTETFKYVVVNPS
jgi:hypothetical protein